MNFPNGGLSRIRNVAAGLFSAHYIQKIVQNQGTPFVSERGGDHFKMGVNSRPAKSPIQGRPIKHDARRLLSRHWANSG